MSLLKTVNKMAEIKRRIVECDATVAGDVAGAAAPLMGANTMIKRINDATINKSAAKAKPKKVKPAAIKEGLNLKAAFSALREGGEEQFDQTSVIAKLKSLEDKEKTDIRDTTVFGIEDDDGQVVRVTVRADQAVEFEKALQGVMAEFEEDDTASTEIAEVLYKLKDHFDIVDVVWPDVQEDEEETVDEFGNEQGAPGEVGDGLEGLEDGPDAGGDLGDLEGGDLDDLGGGAGEGEVQSLLTQVIDMMKADAEARKADAEARIADARQREQEAGAKAALAKIKQEEQFLDMEDYEKKQKAQEKEAKRLAQLARWKREMGGDGYSDATADEGPEMGLPSKSGPVGGYEEEEIRRHTTRVGAADLARHLLRGKQ